MKKLFSLLIISLFWFSTNAQSTAEISTENTLPTVQNNSDKPQDHPDDLPGTQDALNLAPVYFFLLIIRRWNTAVIMVRSEI
jgi:hypothetical protein